MVNFIYPEKEDLKIFIDVLKSGQYTISKYIPETNNDWFDCIFDCIRYIKETHHYQHNPSVHNIASRILYKVVKRHELGDGNKRSGVIVVYIFYLLNNFAIINPEELKRQAKRIARTRGRFFEELIKRRISEKLEKITENFD